MTPDQVKPGLADADAVAQRLAVALYQEQELVGRIDHDGAGAFLAVIVDQLLFEFRIERAPGRIAGRLLLETALLRFGLRQRRTAHVVGRLLLIDRLLLVALALVLSVTEQEFDEAAAHVGALGRGRPHRRGGGAARVGRRRSRWVRAVVRLDRRGLMKSGSQTGRAGERAQERFF